MKRRASSDTFVVHAYVALMFLVGQEYTRWRRFLSELEG